MEKKEQDVIQELMGKLETYLSHFNIKRNGDLYSCINPEHEDYDPSMSIGGGLNKQVFHCFGCKCSGNIFHAAHYLENLPINGPEFFTVTVARLAKRFSIDYTPADLSDSQKEDIQHRQAVADASRTIVSFVTSDWDKESNPEHISIIKARGINLDSVKDFKIGSIPSVKEYKKLMLSKGWSEEYLETKMLLGKGIFEVGKIIITISDHLGRPVGFVARDSKWSIGSGTPKYKNSDDSSVYKKSSIAFGLDLAKAHIKNKPLYFVEGYIDAITLRQAGFKNVCALGSAGFSGELSNFLVERKSTGKSEFAKLESVVLCFDGDEAGAGCTRQAIELLNKDFNVEVKQLPFLDGYHDPDEVVTKQGLKAFEDLEVLSAFKWGLRYYRDKITEPEEVFIKRNASLIASVDSPIERRSKARDLHEVLVSKGTLFTLDDLIKEIEFIKGDKQSKLHYEMESVFDDMILKRKTMKGDNLVELLSTTFAQIKKKQREFSQKHGNLDEIYKQQITDIRMGFNKTKTLNGFKMTRFRELQYLFDGFPDTECLFAVAGDANIGKSTWIREVSWDLAQSNKDAIVLYMSIDDSTKDVMQSIVAREAQLSRDCVYKYGSLAAENPDSDVVNSIDDAWTRVLNQKNYIVADATQGSSIMHLEDHLDFMKKNFPNHRPIIFLDNFHKLRYSEDTSIREKFIDLAQRIKELTQIENIPIVMTVELRKTEHGKRPTLGDIAETKQIEYDAKVVMIAYQDMHNNPDTNIKWQRDNYGDTLSWLPYLELQIAKNKHTDKKRWIGYRFEPDRSTLIEVDYATEIQPKRSPNKNNNN